MSRPRSYYRLGAQALTADRPAWVAAWLARSHTFSREAGAILGVKQGPHPSGITPLKENPLEAVVREMPQTALMSRSDLAGLFGLSRRGVGRRLVRAVREGWIEVAP